MIEIPVIELERSLLRRCLDGDVPIISHAVTTLGGYKLSEESTDWVWRTLRQHFQETGEVLDADVLATMVRDLPEEAAGPLLDELDTIAAVEPCKSPRALIRALISKATTSAALRVMERASEKFAAGDADEAKRIIAHGLPENNKPGPRAKPLLPRRFKSLIHAPRIPTSIYQLDEVIGGIQRGEAGLVFGTTGMGKSALATTLGWGGVRHGVKVLHIDTENGERVIMSRYLARFTGIPVNLIERDTMGPDTRERLNNWLERNYDRLSRQLKVIYLGMEEYTMDDVEAAIVAAKYDGFVPAEVIFDSPDHMVMDDEADARWERFSAVANKWIRTCQRHDFGGWAISQADMAFEDKLATGRSVADSKQKIRNAAIAMSINKAVDPKTRRVRPGDEKCLWLEKARNSRAKIIIPLETDLNRMCIRSPPGLTIGGREAAAEAAETADEEIA